MAQNFGKNKTQCVTIWSQCLELPRALGEEDKEGLPVELETIEAPDPSSLLEQLLLLLRAWIVA